MASQPDDLLAALLNEGQGLATGRSHHRQARTSRPSTMAPNRPPSRASDDRASDDRATDDRATDHLGMPEGANDYSRSMNGRRTSTLQRTWIDPAEMPFTPVPRPGSPMVSRVLSLGASSVILALLAWLIIPEVDHRLTSLRTMVLRDGVLSAQAVQLSPPAPAIVRELFVDATDISDTDLPAGTPIARVESLDRDGEKVETLLSVPFDARFASVNLLEGGVTYPGAPVATVYDPSRMYVIMTVTAETLEVLKRGMRAKLSTHVLAKPINGTVISAVPLLGTDHNPTTAKLVNVRIRPDAAEMAQLVPGVRFNATIDLSSAPKDAPRLVFSMSSSEAPVPASTVPGGTVPGSAVPGSAVPGSTLPDSTLPGTTVPPFSSDTSETNNATIR
jgi:HlyD family secretion protein